MNTKIKSVLVALITLSVFSLGFFANTNNASAQYAVPTCNSATLNGNIVTNGATTSVWFEWGPGSSIIYSTPYQTFYADSNYSQVITGLVENSVYSYRAMAVNQNGKSTGQTISFTTTSCGGTTTPPPAQTYSPIATINSTASCTAPCNAVVSWTSSGVAPTTLKIYKNGTFIWNQTPNVSGSETDWGLPQGTYRYCARAENANWTSETGDLACSTTTVNAATTYVPPAQTYSPTATISSTASCTAPCNAQVNWSSQNVAPTTVKIYKNGTFLWNQTQNISGSQTDWNLIQGSYRYCIRAENADWTSETGDLACSTTTVNAATTYVPPASVMSGTLTPATYSCVIPSGSTSCNINFSWNTINPVAVSAVTSNGTTYANGNSGSSAFAISLGSKTFYLYNNNVLLDQKTVSASCVSSSTWNGGVCQTNIVAPQTCQDTTATNYGGTPPCTYAPQTCQDPSATNYHGTLPCAYAPQVCQDTSALNYHGTLPCRYSGPTCQDTTATNYGGTPPCTYAPQVCQDPSATNYHGALPCAYAPQVCQDTSALNYHGTLPCRYSGPTCQDTTATNYGGTPPCTYAPQVCQDPSATNYHGALPCAYAQNSSGGVNSVFGITSSTNTNTSTSTSANTNTTTGTNTNTNTYTNNNPIVNNNVNNNNPVINVSVNGGADNTVQTCQDSSATNYRGVLPCTYYNYNVQTCQDPSATNYRGILPCTYYNYNTIQTCQDSSATNYRGVLPCVYYNNYSIQTCQDVNAMNYRGVLPCTYQNNYQNVGGQPTVVVFADQDSVAYNGTATVSWITTNATSCNASDGSIGWAGVKSIGPGSFFTGSLTGTRTYTLTCTNGFGSATDSATITVRGRTIFNPANPVAPTSLVLITSSVDRNQPIVPTVDNSRPHPGDEINYTVSYQNIGTGSITSLNLRLDLPYEVDYLFSNPNNPTISGQTLIFNLGTLKANGQGTVTVRVRVRDNIPAGTNLNFPATLSYINPAGAPQSVNANVTAQVWSEPTATTNTNNSALGANVFGSGVFFPVDLLGWLVLLILILVLIFLSKYTYRQLKKK
jgi:hypothetical protein